MEVAPQELAQLLKLAGVGTGPDPEPEIVTPEPEMASEPEVSVMAIPSDDGAPVGGCGGAPEIDHDHPHEHGDMRSIIDMLAQDKPIEEPVEESPPKGEFQNASKEFNADPHSVQDNYDDFSYEPARNTGMQRRTNSYGDNPLREEDLIKEYTEFKKKGLNEYAPGTDSKGNTFYITQDNKKFPSEQHAKQHELQNPNASWPKKNQPAVNKPAQVKPPVNQAEIDAQKQEYMAAGNQRTKSVTPNNLDQQMSNPGNTNSFDAHMSQGKVRDPARLAQQNLNTSVASGTGNPAHKAAGIEGTKVNRNTSVASGTGQSGPVGMDDAPKLYHGHPMFKDPEPEAASTEVDPQRKLPASVHDEEGPGSIDKLFSRDAREMKTIGDVRKTLAHHGIQDPWATRQKPSAQMTQAQIDARNADPTHRFAKDKDGNPINKKQKRLAQALINPPRDDEQIAANDYSQPSADDSEFDRKVSRNDTSGQRADHDVAGAEVKPTSVSWVDDTADTSGIRPPVKNIPQDLSFGKGERAKEDEKGTGDQFNNMTAIGGTTSGGEQGPTAGGTDTNTTLQTDLDQKDFKSFADAFAYYRNLYGPGRKFTYDGKRYTTDRADD